ncbi:unnamed protein product [Arctia plantaginis]|uniref:Uncharacterized protein n=1 Tax=Arctia plantaginis TaxID=874455 RepID=A0A8S1AKT1_ARCPL|nr:unnamed protein product [Arctia plantaginis]CAB3246062.1 unnamed protein product [Arctia plantaginis]
MSTGTATTEGLKCPTRLLTGILIEFQKTELSAFKAGRSTPAGFEGAGRSPTRRLVIVNAWCRAASYCRRTARPAGPRRRGWAAAATRNGARPRPARAPAPAPRAPPPC